MRVPGRDLGERLEQPAHGQRVLLAGLPEPGPAGVLEECVHARGVREPMGGELHRHQALEPVASVLQVAVDVLGPVRPVVGAGQGLAGGDRLGPGDEGDLALAGGDGRGQLVDELLRALAAGDLQDRPPRRRADPQGDRPREVVRASERGPRPRRGVVELPRGRERVHGRRDGDEVGAAVAEGLACRIGGQVDGRAAAVVRVLEPLGRLPDADNDRGPGIEVPVPQVWRHPSAAWNCSRAWPR